LLCTKLGTHVQNAYTVHTICCRQDIPSIVRKKRSASILDLTNRTAADYSCVATVIINYKVESTCRLIKLYNFLFSCRWSYSQTRNSFTTTTAKILYRKWAYTDHSTVLSLESM